MSGGEMPVLYLLDVPEFQSAAESCEKSDAYRISRGNGYVRVESDTDILIERAGTSMNEAVWFGLTVAGYDGTIQEFSSDRLRIGPGNG